MWRGRANLAHMMLLAGSRVAALGALGLVLAYWSWAWLAPAASPTAVEVSAPPGRLAAADQLFGHGADDAGASAGTPTGLAVKLLGIIAGQPQGSGYALLQLDAKQTHVVRAGAELAPGVRVERVLPQQVILQRNGTRETLAWPHPGQAPATSASAPIR